MLESNFQIQSLQIQSFLLLIWWISSASYHSVLYLFLRKTSLGQKPVPIFHFEEVHEPALSRATHLFCNQLNTPRFTLSYSCHQKCKGISVEPAFGLCVLSKLLKRVGATWWTTWKRPNSLCWFSFEGFSLTKTKNFPTSFPGSSLVQFITS